MQNEICYEIFEQFSRPIQEKLKFVLADRNTKHHIYSGREGVKWLVGHAQRNTLSHRLISSSFGQMICTVQKKKFFVQLKARNRANNNSTYKQNKKTKNTQIFFFL